MNTPTSKEIDNLNKLIEMGPMLSGFAFLDKENVAKTLIHFGDSYKVVGASKPNCRASIIIQNIKDKKLYVLTWIKWELAAQREQLHFE